MSTQIHPVPTPTRPKVKHAWEPTENDERTSSGGSGPAGSNVSVEIEMTHITSSDTEMKHGNISPSGGAPALSPVPHFDLPPIQTDVISAAHYENSGGMFLVFTLHIFISNASLS
jgi:hypothetical protein